LRNIRITIADKSWRENDYYQKKSFFLIVRIIIIIIMAEMILTYLLTYLLDRIWKRNDNQSHCRVRFYMLEP